MLTRIVFSVPCMLVLTTWATAADRDYAACQLKTRLGPVSVLASRDGGAKRLVCNSDNPSAFITFRQEKEGWVIGYADRGSSDAKDVSDPHMMYLSYRLETPPATSESKSLVFLSPKLESNSYWKVVFDNRTPPDGTTVYMRPLQGEFANWYVSAADQDESPLRELTLRRTQDWLKMTTSGYGNRTIKYRGSGCLSLEGDRHKIVFQNNTAGFNGIWTLREGEQGWLIICEPARSDVDQQPLYLSYRQSKVDDPNATAAGQMVFLTDSPQANSFWRIDPSSRLTNNFKGVIQPQWGDFREWYLAAGAEISDAATPAFKKKSAVTLNQVKPLEPLEIVVDGR